jgi:hypothetical protein
MNPYMGTRVGETLTGGNQMRSRLDTAQVACASGPAWDLP